MTLTLKLSLGLAVVLSYLSFYYNEKKKQLEFSEIDATYFSDSAESASERRMRVFQRDSIKNLLGLREEISKLLIFTHLSLLAIILAG